MRWSETVGHQMLDWDGKPTAPVSAAVAADVN
jgi:hypothetical protein